MSLPADYNIYVSSGSISVHWVFSSLWGISSFCMPTYLWPNATQCHIFLSVYFCCPYILLSFVCDTVKLLRNSFLSFWGFAIKIHSARPEPSLVRASYSYSQLLRQDPSNSLSNDVQIMSFSNMAGGNLQCSQLCVFQVFFLLIHSDGSFFGLIVSLKTCVDQYSSKPSEASLEIWSSL